MARSAQISLSILLFVLWPILPAVCAETAAIAERINGKQPTLKDLGTLYRELELPLPPREAGFACVGPLRTDWEADREQPNFELRFAIEDPNRKTVQRIWKEFSEGKFEKIEEFYPQAPSADTVLKFMKLNRLKGPPNEIDESRPELIFAIQCHLLGHEELARFFYWRCLKAEPADPDQTITLDQILLIAAWNFWAEELINPNRDRVAVSKRLTLLATKFDVLNVLADLYGDSEDDHKRQTFYDFHKQLLDRIDLTLKASRAKPGSIEWLVDKLADVASGPTDETKWLLDEERWDRKVQIHRRKVQFLGDQSKIERELVELGFEAIPVLLDHIDDKRLTRIPVVANGGMRGNLWRTVVASRFTTVDILVRRILSTFFDFGKDSPNGLTEIKKSDYLNAWEKIKLKTEASWISEKLAKPERLDERLLGFIMAKYPDKALAFYQTILKENNEFSHFRSLVYFIVDSHLPKSSKIERLTLAARHGRFSFQSAALAGLLELDNPLFTKICLESLAKLPKRSNDDDETLHQLQLLRLVLCSQDEAAQQWVINYAKASRLDLSMALIFDISPGHYLPTEHQFFRFYRAFLDDHALYDVDENHEPVFQNLLSDYRKMEIRNLVAMRVLQALSISYTLDDKTPPETWAKVRTFVKNELERRLEMGKPK